MKKRGQAATEYIMIAGFVFFAIMVSVSVLYKEGSQSFDEIVVSQLRSICLKITDLAESTYYMGPPARQTVSVNFPSGVRNLTIERNDPASTGCTRCTELRFYLGSGEKQVPVICSTPVDIRADINELYYSPGEKSFVLESYDTYVQLNVT